MLSCSLAVTVAVFDADSSTVQPAHDKLHYSPQGVLKGALKIHRVRYLSYAVRAPRNAASGQVPSCFVGGLDGVYEREHSYALVIRTCVFSLSLSTRHAPGLRTLADSCPARGVGAERDSNSSHPPVVKGPLAR